MKFRPLKNYTLLEILVVVAIIVILCSLLFSGFTHVKETAKRMNCLNKTKDIAWAQGACASENNGNIPIPGAYASVVDRTQEIGKQTSVTTAGPAASLMAKFGIHNLQYYKDLSVNGNKGDEREDYWRLVCENAVATWTSKAYHNPQIYGYASTHVKQKRPKITFWSTYFLGSFDYNMDSARTITISTVGTNLQTGQAMVKVSNFKQLLVSDVKAPSERVYVVEGGEQENENNFHELKRLYYGETIKAGMPYDWSVTGATSDGTGYIAGYGGGGVGKESMEKGGFRSEVTTRENFAEIEQDVMQGRHGGYTLHGFFDGSARAISADEVGRNQADDDLTEPKPGGGKGVDSGRVTGLYRRADLGGGDGND